MTLLCRLRAGLCDRCSVTQEFAKRRQQEFEASHLQSLQHISLMGRFTSTESSVVSPALGGVLICSCTCFTAGEMNTLKKENKRLKEENRVLTAALQ